MMEKQAALNSASSRGRGFSRAIFDAIAAGSLAALVIWAALDGREDRFSIASSTGNYVWRLDRRTGQLSACYNPGFEARPVCGPFGDDTFAERRAARNEANAASEKAKADVLPRKMTDEEFGRFLDWAKKNAGRGPNNPP